MSAQESSPSDTHAVLSAAIRKARHGDKEKARQMLLEIVEAEPFQEEVWLWLAGLAEDLADAQVYLETVLALNPAHPQAQKGLTLVKEKQAHAKPAPTGAPSAVTCPQCGQAQPVKAPFCPSCGHLEGKPAVDEVAELQSIHAVEPPVDVSAEVTPSFTLSIEQAEAIDACLERMAYESEASSIILADVTGQLISERGRTTGIKTQVLSALAAGELSATQEMARLVGEKARFNLLLHEGEERSVYLSPVGHKMLLIIVFDGRTPIGLVRIILKNAVEELGPILEQRAERASGAFDSPFSETFAQQVEDEIDASMKFLTE